MKFKAYLIMVAIYSASILLTEGAEWLHAGEILIMAALMTAIGWKVGKQAPKRIGPSP